MDKIIVLNDGKEYFANSFEEVISLFFGADYMQKDFNEKYKTRYQKGLIISMKDGLDLVDTRVGKLDSNAQVVSPKYDFSKAFIIDNEITYILSLCKFEDVVLMEEKESNIFNVDGLVEFKDNDNYSIINKYCDEMLLLNLKKML